MAESRAAAPLQSLTPVRQILGSGGYTFPVPWTSLPKETLDKLSMNERNKVRANQNDIDILKLAIVKKLVSSYTDYKDSHPGLKKHPGSKIYESITNQVFEKFPYTLADVVNGKQVGNGMASFQRAILVCTENQMREKNAPKAIPDAMRATGIIGVLEAEYLPNLDGNAREEQEAIRAELQVLYNEDGDTWCWDEIREKMLNSYELQRNDIASAKVAIEQAINNKENEETESEDPPVKALSELMNLWPFLFYTSCLTDHHNRLTGRDLQPHLDDFLENHLEYTLHFLTSCSKANKKNMALNLKLDKKIANWSVPQKFLKAVTMIANHFGEEKYSFVHSAERTAPASDIDTKELADICIIARGGSLKPWLRHALPTTLALLAAWRWSQAPEESLGGPLVRVEQGLLQGAHRLTLHDAIPYFSFQGIPYARPPVHDLRFKAPLPPASWPDVRPALEEGHMCCQPHTEIYWMPREVNKMELPSLRRAWNIVSSLPRLWQQIQRFWAQQEDCLFLNVYTKQIRAAGSEDDEDLGSAKLSPVVVFLHGGAFYTGTANSHIYGPDFLLREDVVLVTVQYRLGALGFLAVGSRDAPGNAGLKDQALALQWVQRNIRRFGGDPSSVTLLGHSAGGAAVHYHAMSPGSRGLFHRAVQLSGCALNAWAFATPAEASARAGRLGSLLGCGAQCASPDGLVAFLRTKTPRELIEASYLVFDNEETAAGLIAPFVPTVEDTRSNPNDTSAFLRVSPAEVMLGRSADYWPVPTLVGQNDAEGMIVLMPDIITTDMTPSARNLALLQEDFERAVPVELGLARGSATSRLVADMMRTHYFQGKAISEATITNFVQMYGDLLFSVGLGRYMRALTRVSSQPAFFYLFTFDGKLSVIKKLARSELPGVSHGDELGYLFPVDMMPAEDIRPGDVDLLVRDRWTRMVANFAKFGSPTGAAADSAVDGILNVSWPSSTATTPRYVDVGATMQLRQGFPLDATFRFWETVYRAVGRQAGSG